MKDSKFKLTVRWKNLVFEFDIPITEEQQNMIVQKALLLVYGEKQIEHGAHNETYNGLLEEEEHLRKLLLQLNTNRRNLETQQAQLGPLDTPLHIINQITETNKQIQQISEKLNKISQQLDSGNS